MNNVVAFPKSRQENLAYAYRIAARRRKAAISSLIESEYACARLALEAYRLVPAGIEAVDIALIASHHRANARRLRAQLRGEIEL